MHEFVRARLQRNADYHAAVAEHYAAQQQKATESEAPTPAEPMLPPPTNGRRGRTTVAPATVIDDVTRLIEMHAGAAQQLRDLLANEPVQAIVQQRARQTITRRQAMASLRVH